MEPKIEIICGPMFSGKTEELIRRLKRLKYSKQDFLLFKPKMDNRYSEDMVITHDKVEISAIPIEKAADILSICDEHPNVKVVAIDEAQFFYNEPSYNLVKVVQMLKLNDYRVIINGLDMDFQGNPFGLMPQLMAIADDIKKLKSVCVICGNDANMSSRLVSADHLSIVELGSQDKYQPRCYKHWKEAQAIKKED
jgi:thymidine kinase